MNVFNEIKWNIDETKVLSLLGYNKNNVPSEEILKRIRYEIAGCGDYLNPVVYYEYFNIKSKRDNKIILENGVAFEGEFISEKLMNCNKIIAAVITLGAGVNEVIDNAFNEGDYLRALIMDSIATEAIGYVNKVFWQKIVDDIKNTNLGLTQVMSPGDARWELQEQAKIFKCMGDEFSEVKLNDSFLMIPSKSLAQVYGFGENIGIAKNEHICIECSMKHCAYRSDGKIPLTIQSEDTKEIIDVQKDENLLDILKKQNYFIDNPCNGKGTCGKCRVIVKKGNVEVSHQDKVHFSISELEMGYRLACRINVQEKLEVEITHVDNFMVVMTKGNDDLLCESKLDPVVKKIHCIMEKPSLEDQRDDFTRLKNSLGLSKLNINLNYMQCLSENLRNYDFNATAVLYEDNLIALENGNTSDNFYGIAADIGTTTIAVYLLNLNTGKTIDVESAVNSQKNYGADVISRINYTIENKEGLKVLKDAVVSQLNLMIEKLCNKNNIAVENIYDISIVGNTTMIHLFLGFPCENIAIAPYIPAFNSPLTIKAREAGLITNGILSIAPGISSYVGSDITTGILSCNMMDSEKYSLLLDIGTNGEMALGNKDCVITCATAAGPAFEGANIKYGMAGIKGAISKIDLSKEKIYETIDHGMPIGICGSGVLDCVAQMLEFNIIDKTGKMIDFDETDDIEDTEYLEYIQKLDQRFKFRLTEIDGIKQFIIAKKEEGTPITFTQKDVREVQLAKSAINAGIQIMLKEKNLNYEDINKVYMGGGFGNYMDIESAAIVGLIPMELKDKVVSVGNCAGTGAKLYLLFNNFRKKAEDLIDKTTHIELSSSADFMDYFMNGMKF